MNTGLISTLLGVLGTKDGKQLLAMLGKDPRIDDMIVKSLGAGGKSQVTAQDITDVKDFVKAYNDAGRTTADETVAQLRNVMMQDPRVRAIIAGVRALSEGSRAAGNMAVTHANRLAEALLARTRSGGDQQRSMYGPSKLEQAATAYGTNKIRKAEMAKHITDAVSNTIDKTIGDYSAQDLAVRAMSTAPYLQGTPGALYQMINGMQGRIQKVTP